MHEMTTFSNASCTTNFLTPMEKVDNKEFGIFKDLMTLIYATTTAWKVTDVLVMKDIHIGHGVGKYITPISNVIAKEVGKVLLELYGKFIGKIYEILNHQ